MHVFKRVLNAGCDMGLVCNDRTGSMYGFRWHSKLALPNQQRLERMRGKIPNIQVGSTLNLDESWQNAKKKSLKTFKNSF